ncbi:YihY/virulence factor BrkB family protein [Leifsonia sp. 2TAF2]|uniref:YihY/virulence factor BrkB family protein n=1 Tax=Leifsonia sp. 2TAF2 TaxID=3233009 RepID=UPI003F94B597
MAKKTKGASLQPDPALQRAEGSVEPEPEESLKERLLERADPLRRRLRKPVARVSRWAKWVQSLRPYRVYINFSHSDGNLRAAGMGYQSLFAVFAAIWVGFSISSYWLAGNDQLFDALVTLLNRAIPGLIATSTSPGIIPESQLQGATSFGWTGVIAAIGLIWTAIGWLYYTRQAVRAVFGLNRDTTNYVLQKIRDFGLAVIFGVLFVVSAVISILSTQTLTLLLELAGLSSESVWTNAAARFSGLVVSVVLNIVTLGAMFRIMSRVAIPWRNLFFGVLLGALVLAGLSALGGLLFGAASTRNPLLATFTVFIGLLLWFNLISRVILLSASWIAVGMFDRGISPRAVTREQAAAEQAAAEYEARVLVSRSELLHAQQELDEARWFARIPAQRRAARAEQRLNDLLDEGAVGSPR